MQTGKTDSIQHICKNDDSFYVDIVQAKSFSVFFLNHILIAGTQSFGTSYSNSQGSFHLHMETSSFFFHVFPDGVSKFMGN